MMLRTLLESQATRTRRIGGAAVSVGVHTAIIGLAIVATARATSAPPRRALITPYVVYPVAPPPVDRWMTIEDGAMVGTPVPPVIEGPLVPPVVISTKLPPLDLARLVVADTDFIGRGYDRGGVFRDGYSRRGLASPRDSVFTLATVEKAAVPRGVNPAPIYPSALRAASIEGSVVARFIVDTTGRAEAQSIIFLEATHPLFADAVRQALLRSRYLPAMIGEHPIRQLVEQRFAFTLRVEKSSF